ncbi:MAG: FtsQ-type POTRA domain-containing protein [Boseongicola sp.]|nr:MAG: FtsQ-type POTRA domain-containing protein [Boseongicola sp.]
MRPMRDPAPSRLAYRMNRLMLTPRFRVFLRFGLPVLLVSAGVAYWASDDTRVAGAGDRFAEVKRQIEQRPEFLVHMMAVEDASDEIANDIRAVLPLDFPVSSFDLDLDDIQTEVEKLNAVAAVAVHIRSGGVLSIEVQERIPAIVWRGPDGLELLDADGHSVKTISSRADRSDLPLIVGKGANENVREGLQLMSIVQGADGRLRGLVRVGERRWDVVLDRDQKIMLPETDAEAALRKVMALNASQDLLARDIAAIDFRNPRRPVLKLTAGAVESMIEIQMTETKDTLR